MPAYLSGRCKRECPYILVKEIFEIFFEKNGEGCGENARELARNKIYAKRKIRTMQYMGEYRRVKKMSRRDRRDVGILS
jgi:hypothetical protein